MARTKEVKHDKSSTTTVIRDGHPKRKRMIVKVPKETIIVKVPKETDDEGVHHAPELPRRGEKVCWSTKVVGDWVVKTGKKCPPEYRSRKQKAMQMAKETKEAPRVSKTISRRREQSPSDDESSHRKCYDKSGKLVKGTSKSRCPPGSRNRRPKTVSTEVNNKKAPTKEEPPPPKKTVPPKEAPPPKKTTPPPKEPPPPPKKTTPPPAPTPLDLEFIRYQMRQRANLRARNQKANNQYYKARVQAKLEKKKNEKQVEQEAVDDILEKMGAPPKKRVFKGRKPSKRQ